MLQRNQTNTEPPPRSDRGRLDPLLQRSIGENTRGRYDHDETMALIRVAQRGRTREARDAARNEIAERNLPLVQSIARGFRGRGLEPEDLFQEGTIGLLAAVRRFDLGRADKPRFSTYATYWIRQQIGQALRNHTADVRIPAYMQHLIGKLARVQGAAAEAGRPLSIAQAADRMELRPRSRQILLYTRGLLDASRRGRKDVNPLRIANLPARDTEDDVNEAMDVAELWARVEAAMETLPERTVHILHRRFGIPPFAATTLAKIGEEFGLSKERINQITRAGLALILCHLGGQIDSREDEEEVSDCTENLAILEARWRAVSGYGNSRGA